MIGLVLFVDRSTALGVPLVQLGQHPRPAHTLVHFSDPHFLAGGRRLFGAVDTDAGLLSSLKRLERFGRAPEAIVMTGDLADLAEVDAYERLKRLVEAAAQRLSCQVVWVMGNHDDRAAFASVLFGEHGVTDEPQDRVWRLGGLRLIALDTSVPGYHHGELTDDQLDWLGDELATRAPEGTVVALHHPPLPSPVEIMSIIELRDQQRLERVLRGSDVRVILGGHLHYSTYGTFAGIPVSVAAATCYTIDPGGAPREFRGVDGGQGFTLVEVYEDRIVHSVVPAVGWPAVHGYGPAELDRLAALSPDERIEAFSRKR